MKSAVLHDPTSVFSLRHAPSWMLLAFGAGSVNAAAFLACQRYVTHVTGTATRLGLDAGQWVLMIDYFIVLACFVLGAMTSVLALDGRVHRGKPPLHAVPLLAVAGLLTLVAALGALGFFGPFGATVEQPSDFALLSMLGFAMGLQNATVATSTGLAVRTTHMTGPASDLGVHLGTLFFATGEARQAALRGAALRAGKLASFILGGVAALYLARASGYLAFLLPVATVLVATASSFVPAPSRAPARVPVAAS